MGNYISKRKKHPFIEYPEYQSPNDYIQHDFNKKNTKGSVKNIYKEPITYPYPKIYLYDENWY